MVYSLEKAISFRFLTFRTKRKIAQILLNNRRFLARNLKSDQIPLRRLGFHCFPVLSLDAVLFGLFTRESDFFFALFTRKNLRKIDSNLPSNFDNRCQHFRPKKDDGNTLPILPGCKLQMRCRYHLRVSLFLSLAVFYLDFARLALFRVRALFFAFLCARVPICSGRRGSLTDIHGARKKFLGLGRDCRLYTFCAKRW